jgi:hypothetical protein
MLRSVRSLELSSTAFSDEAAVGGVEAEFMDAVELATEGAGEARYSVVPEEAEAMLWYERQPYTREIRRYNE